MSYTLQPWLLLQYKGYPQKKKKKQHSTTMVNNVLWRIHDVVIDTSRFVVLHSHSGYKTEDKSTERKKKSIIFVETKALWIPFSLTLSISLISSGNGSGQNITYRVHSDIISFIERVKSINQPLSHHTHILKIHQQIIVII